MKLKGLVWLFTIALLLLSLWQLSYTFVVRNYENEARTLAERQVRASVANLSPEEKRAIIERRTEAILDSTKEKAIYPLIGTTYKKSKEYELNLGLDLQGGMAVTLDVALDGFLKSLSNNPLDPALNNALKTANVQKINSNTNYIDLFATAYSAANGAGKLSSLFAGPDREVKVTDNDATVITKLKTQAKGAIDQTYQIINKRIDKFGVASPNINLDENRGVINVELAGVKDPERVRKVLQSSANLQFWEVYRIDEIANELQTADKNLQQYLVRGGITDTTLVDTLATDSAKLAQFANPLFKVMNPLQPQQDQNGRTYFPPAIGQVLYEDTAKLNSYLNNPVVKNTFPANLRFMYGIEEKAATGAQRFFQVYAIKTIPGSIKAQLEGDQVETASQGYDERSRPAINMKMTTTGARTWARMTGKNIGRPIAIALDNVVYSAPNVNGAIEGGNSEISGNFTVQEAQDLANILQSGKVDAPAHIVAEQVVGPTLGQEAVKGGAVAFAIAFAVIFLLMVLYYNTSGWVANIALILNLLFTIGVLSALGLTLTAAGIAGLVLTIGMAVDTNVIIFERIKDELAKGKSYQQAVDDGYRRSLPPVFDAHVTSLITAIILFYFGLGPVLGFATTQIIGLLLSMFCGILVSRLVTDLLTRKGRHLKYFTSFSQRIFKHAKYNFVKFRKYAYMISLVILVLGIGTLFNGFHQGVEFKGGRSYTIAFPQDMNNDLIRDELNAALDGDNPIIKTVNDSRHLNITTAYLKGVDNADSAVEARLYQGLQKHLPNVSLESFRANSIEAKQLIQPSISEDLKKGAVKATVFSIILIFLYIFLRFRDWRYSLGTIFTLLHDVLVTMIVFSYFKNIVPFPLEIDQHFIAAILTVIGFSMNDTVIVFDRVREYSRDRKGDSKENIVNDAINHTLSRTIMTSLTVFLVILILFIFGPEITRGFAFAMLIGVITGTYSTIFVGAPVLLEFAKNKPLGEAKEKRVRDVAPEL